MNSIKKYCHHFKSLAIAFFFVIAFAYMIYNMPTISKNVITLALHIYVFIHLTQWITKHKCHSLICRYVTDIFIISIFYLIIKYMPEYTEKIMLIACGTFFQLLSLWIGYFIINGNTENNKLNNEE